MKFVRRIVIIFKKIKLLVVVILNKLEFQKMDESLNTLNRIVSSKDLCAINGLLTKEMASQRIQALIRDDNLDKIVNTIINLGASSEEGAIFAASILGRLGAVARGRQDVVFGQINSLLKNEPLPIELLEDGDAKYYAAVAIAHCTGNWLLSYSISQALEIDTSEKTRKVFVQTALVIAGSLSNFFQEISPNMGVLNELTGNDTRYRRIRRITHVVHLAVREWEQDVGFDIGASLDSWLKRVLASDKSGIEELVLADIINDVFGILIRIIELRFSNALLAETYAVLESVRFHTGNLWTMLHRKISNLEKIRVSLLEAALVLARQGKTDLGIIKALNSAYYSRSQTQAAVRSHFRQADELDPNVKAWWERAGAASNVRRQVEHEYSNSEDHLIGLLLLETKELEGLVNHIDDSILPTLHLGLVDRSYMDDMIRKLKEIMQINKQLAQMRRLTEKNMLGKMIDYEPRQHELIGGHRLGVRLVKVERDGVEKVFGSRTRIFIKPRVLEIQN